MIDPRELFSYAFSGEVPAAFARHLLQHADRWDEEFRQRLEELAYEFRPDLAVWVIKVDDDGGLRERRLPLL